VHCVRAVGKTFFDPDRLRREKSRAFTVVAQEVRVSIKTVARGLPLMIFGLLGCSESTDPRRLAECGLFGTADVSVSGAHTSSVEGCAAFFVVAQSGSTPAQFTLTMSEGGLDDEGDAISLGRQGGRPANGAYSIGENAGNFNGVLTTEEGQVYAFTSGTVNITTSGSGGVAGSLNLTATGGTTGTATVTVSGTFSARCINTDQTDC
jgi:hypothetical protein